MRKEKGLTLENVYTPIVQGMSEDDSSKIIQCIKSFGQDRLDEVVEASGFKTQLQLSSISTHAQKEFIHAQKQGGDFCSTTLYMALSYAHYDYHPKLDNAECNRTRNAVFQEKLLGENLNLETIDKLRFGTPKTWPDDNITPLLRHPNSISQHRVVRIRKTGLGVYQNDDSMLVSNIDEISYFIAKIATDKIKVSLGDGKIEFQKQLHKLVRSYFIGNFKYASDVAKNYLPDFVKEIGDELGDELLAGSVYQFDEIRVMKCFANTTFAKIVSCFTLYDDLTSDVIDRNLHDVVAQQQEVLSKLSLGYLRLESIDLKLNKSLRCSFNEKRSVMLSTLDRYNDLSIMEPDKYYPTALKWFISLKFTDDKDVFNTMLDTFLGSHPNLHKILPGNDFREGFIWISMAFAMEVWDILKTSTRAWEEERRGKKSILPKGIMKKMMQDRVEELPAAHVNTVLLYPTFAYTSLGILASAAEWVENPDYKLNEDDVLKLQVVTKSGPKGQEKYHNIFADRDFNFWGKEHDIFADPKIAQHISYDSMLSILLNFLQQNLFKVATVCTAIALVACAGYYGAAISGIGTAISGALGNGKRVILPNTCLAC